ncbi:hypothetical protein HanIR_Chr15g0772501 [Helianthus annuus]|nr:hypothetical protein HanIR_Chr15g0772501 [Helianthus annuus]
MIYVPISLLFISLKRGIILFFFERPTKILLIVARSYKPNLQRFPPNFTPLHHYKTPKLNRLQFSHVRETTFDRLFTHKNAIDLISSKDLATFGTACLNTTSFRIFHIDQKATSTTA